MGPLLIGLLLIGPKIMGEGNGRGVRNNVGRGEWDGGGMGGGSEGSTKLRHGGFTKLRHGRQSFLLMGLLLIGPY